ncbi:MAG: DUF2569 family protein [Patescibacteria group bacterium]|nr:DUF2569 family protein [Patescibacteria group bacterium]
MKKCDYCSKEIQEGEEKCKHCGNLVKEENKEDKTKKKEGFSGWLALFGLGVFATPIIILLQIIVEPEAYDSVGMFLNILIVIAYAWLAYLMVKRRKIFKKWFLGVGIFQILLTSLIALVANSDTSAFSESELSDINTSVIQTIIYVTIWSLYLWNSKRAKNTFIN